jgi:hypothetical protein
MKQEPFEEFLERVDNIDSTLIWPEPHGLTEPWIQALVAADDNNIAPLVALLREISKRADVPPDVQELWHRTADFLERKFRGTQGVKRTPSYEWPPGIKDLMSAYVTMRLHMNFDGLSVSKAAEETEKEHNVTADALENFHRGKHG